MEKIPTDGEPCDHPGCLNHVTHPCEGCGRIAGKGERMTEEELKEKIMAKFIEYDAWDEDDKVRLRETYTDEILSLIHEAGWRSPEEWNKNEVKWFNIVSKRKPQ